MVDVLTDYLGECTEVKIKDHYVIVYEVRRGGWGGGRVGRREGDRRRGREMGGEGG